MTLAWWIHRRWYMDRRHSTTTRRRRPWSAASQRHDGVPGHWDCWRRRPASWRSAGTWLWYCPSYSSGRSVSHLTTSSRRWPSATFLSVSRAQHSSLPRPHSLSVCRSCIHVVSSTVRHSLPVPLSVSACFLICHWVLPLNKLQNAVKMQGKIIWRQNSNARVNGYFGFDKTVSRK